MSVTGSIKMPSQELVSIVAQDVSPDIGKMQIDEIPQEGKSAKKIERAIPQYSSSIEALILASQLQDQEEELVQESASPRVIETIDTILAAAQVQDAFDMLLRASEISVAVDKTVEKNKRKRNFQDTASKKIKLESDKEMGEIAPKARKVSSRKRRPEPKSMARLVMTSGGGISPAALNLLATASMPLPIQSIQSDCVSEEAKTSGAVICDVCHINATIKTQRLCNPCYRHINFFTCPECKHIKKVQLESGVCDKCAIKKTDSSDNSKQKLTKYKSNELLVKTCTICQTDDFIRDRGACYHCYENKKILNAYSKNVYSVDKIRNCPTCDSPHKIFMLLDDRCMICCLKDRNITSKLI